jgi:tetratricopeptide (TPR) repeat protein
VDSLPWDCAVPQPATASLQEGAELADINSVELRIREAEALLERNECESALAIADLVIAQSRDFASAWLIRGQACKALHRFVDAADAFRFLLELFPDFNAMRIALASVYIELDRLREAEGLLLEAINQQPDFATAHANLGSLHMRMDRYDLAEASLRYALELDDGIVAAHQNLAAILDRRDAAAARKHRDAAYRRQQIFDENTPGTSRTVLILTSSGSGNTPYQHLLPQDRYRRVLWYLEYAPPGQERALPDHDLVFNAVADPDVAADALAAAERFAAGGQRPLINRPDCVARTFRSSMPALMSPIADVVVPGTMRFDRTACDVTSAILKSGLRFPLIVRPAGRHGGEDARLVRFPAELNARLPDFDTVYATEFVDYRSADGWYRKYRIIFVDREPYPYHLAIGAKWLLHYQTADMHFDAARRAEECAFLQNPEAVLGSRVMKALRAIALQLDLDYAGIDFSLLPDGRLLFFEANATMLVHPEDDPLFAYKSEAFQAIVGAMDTMIARQLT